MVRPVLSRLRRRKRRSLSFFDQSSASVMICKINVCIMHHHDGFPNFMCSICLSVLVTFQLSDHWGSRPSYSLSHKLNQHAWRRDWQRSAQTTRVENNNNPAWQWLFLCCLQISLRQGMKADSGTLMSLCEKTDNDIRSCINTLQVSRLSPLMRVCLLL